jgi:hypothetical protein
VHVRARAGDREESAMVKWKVPAWIVAVGFVAAAVPVIATPALDPAVQVKVDEQVKYVQGWASDPAVVSAVKAMNADAPAANKAMTQEKWATSQPFDPFVLSFTTNPVGQFLKTKKNQVISEAFVSAADGTKVGFLGKTSSWSHKGKPKHDVPMTGKTWQGEIETDASTGLQQVQIAVPVMDGGKPIGSVVVGLQMARLK